MSLPMRCISMKDVWDDRTVQGLVQVGKGTWEGAKTGFGEGPLGSWLGPPGGERMSSELG